MSPCAIKIAAAGVQLVKDRKKNMSITTTRVVPQGSTAADPMAAILATMSVAEDRQSAGVQDVMSVFAKFQAETVAALAELKTANRSLKRQLVDVNATLEVLDKAVDSKLGALEEALQTEKRARVVAESKIRSLEAKLGQVENDFKVHSHPLGPNGQNGHTQRASY